MPGSVHLYVMLTHPGSIDPYLSADRVISSNMWFVYLILLICVELHGGHRPLRLCMKWGWLQPKNFKDARETRKKLKQLKNRLTIFFLSLGILSLLVFVVIGIRHSDRAGQPYEPRHAMSAPAHEVEAAPAEEAIEEEHTLMRKRLTLLRPLMKRAAVHGTEATHDAEADAHAAEVDTHGDAAQDGDDHAPAAEETVH